MPDYRRTGYAPWSLTREAGVESATVDGTIEVDQYLQPTIDTGFVDEKGNWKGRKSSDKDFIGITRAESIANGGEVLFPDTNVFPSIDMEGFRDIFYAIKPTNGGNYRVEAVMGPDTESFANLSPVNPASSLRGKLVGVNNENMTDCFIDGSALAAGFEPFLEAATGASGSNARIFTSADTIDALILDAGSTGESAARFRVHVCMVDISRNPLTEAATVSSGT